jgi:hypothetical protein
MKKETGGACMGDGIGAYGVSVGGLRERVHVEDLGIDGRVIPKLIFKRWDGGCGLH